jgi:hypothetical protein
MVNLPPKNKQTNIKLSIIPQFQKLIRVHAKPTEPHLLPQTTKAMMEKKKHIPVRPKHCSFQ